MALLLFSQSPASAQNAPPATLDDGGYPIHIYPTVANAAGHTIAADSGPLLYHSGGAVMVGPVTFYAIFWIPAHLQNGGATTLSADYQNVQKQLLSDYAAHGIDNNNTQYYQIIGGVQSFIQNKGGPGGLAVDNGAYPASGCSDSVTPGNCITDAQIQAKIQAVMTAHGWTGGLNKIFLLFTSSGEGSCFDSSSASCAYTAYCAYHGVFFNGATPIVYANQPFGDPNFCQVPGTPSPHSDAAADTASTAASHEITEAITDPELNAWFTAQGNEIGDLCAYNYGTNTWDANKANQSWNGHFYEIQMEFDNHKSGCQQVGP